MSSSSKFMVMFVTSFWPLVCKTNSDLVSEKPQDGYGDGVSVTPPPGGCQYSCTPAQPVQPPPPPEIYGGPPPPAGRVGGNCPPVAPVMCCQNSPPNTMPYGYPNYGNYTESCSFLSRPSYVWFVLLLLNLH